MTPANAAEGFDADGGSRTYLLVVMVVSCAVGVRGSLLGVSDDPGFIRLKYGICPERGLIKK